MSAPITQQTEAMMNHHLQAVLGGNDLDEILKDYTDESFLLTQERAFRGLQEIRLFFEALLPRLTPEVLSNLQVKRLDYEGPLVYLVASAPPLTSLATDTFVIRDGKIIAQTFTMLG